MAKAKSSDGPTVAKAIRQVSNGNGLSVYKVEDGLDALAAGEEINFVGGKSTPIFCPTLYLTPKIICTMCRAAAAKSVRLHVRSL